MKEIKNVSIIGMGALGVMYGSHLAHHMGFDHVTYIMDEKRYEKYKGKYRHLQRRKTILHHVCLPPRLSLLIWSLWQSNPQDSPKHWTP